MKSYQEIKKEYEEKNYSLVELRKGIILFSLAKILFTEFFIFVISTIPFLLGFFIITFIYGYSFIVSLFYLVIHLLFYTFYVRRVYKKEVLSTLKECDLIIKVLKDLRDSKIK